LSAPVFLPLTLQVFGESLAQHKYRCRERAGSPFIDVRYLNPEDQVELVESYKMEIRELRRLLGKKDEVLSKG
jgi:hypothetical protein